jgi:hypothetical protein
MPDPALAALTRRITEALGETNPHLVRRVVEVLGAEAATAHYTEALRIEAAGGELIASGKRRRTPGGVFFRLVRDAATVEQRQAIGWPTGAGETGQHRPHTEQRIAPLPWETRLAHLQALLDEKGTVNMSKLTLTGRPGKMIEAQGCILTVMATDPGKAPTLPKGLPLPPAQPTKYIVYIAAKQWQKVAEAIQDPGDVLIVEGYPVFDERLPGLAVLTQNITTRNLQRAKRAAEAGSVG